MTTTKRPIGRPPLDRTDPSSGAVHVRLPSKEYDRAYRLSREARVSVPALLRLALKQLRPI